MLLVQLKVTSVVKRISDRLLTLEHTWYPYIISFSAPQWQVEKDYGGFGRLGFGTITISPRLFENDWPPPIQCEINILYTATNEAAAITLFARMAHLTDYDKESVTYKIQDLEYDQKLLSEVDDYDANTVALPRGFGTVTHVTPTRLPDVDIGAPYGDAPTYSLGSLTSAQGALRIIGFTRYSGGSATKVITGDINGDPVSHGYSNGETVIIVNSDNFNGSHVISNASGSTFTIPIPFASGTESLPLYSCVYQDGDVQVYDDGVPISENFYNNGDGTFSLMATPEGQVTISGTASQTTLSALMSWGRTQLGITSYNNTYARSPSPTISAWVTSQQTVLNFLSEICASFSHLFYIKSDTLYLVDMYRDNGSDSLTDFEFLESPKYGKFSPIKKLTSKWQTYSAEVGHSGGEHDLTISHYIKTTDHEISEDLYEYGSELSIPAYHYDEANVRSCLVLIRELLGKDKVTVDLPLSGSLPELGEKLSWTDGALPVDVPGFIRTRTLTFDFVVGVVSITGEGTFLQPGYMSRLIDGAITGATTETMDTFDQSLGKGAVWDYIIDDGAGTNMRVGRISAVWDQAAGSTPIILPGYDSDDIGVTLGIVSFSVDKSADQVRLRCTTTSGSWTISGSRQIIGINSN